MATVYYADKEVLEEVAVKMSQEKFYLKVLPNQVPPENVIIPWQWFVEMGINLKKETA